MTKVTPELIKQINVEYLQCGTYAEVARRVGLSATTVKKYIVPNFKMVDESSIKRFTEDDLPEFSTYMFRGVDNYGDLCMLTEREQREIQELWGELTL